MTPSVLVIDNYDSFTWNLVQLVASLGADVVVHRNNEITVQDALALKTSHIVISPGPGAPANAGICRELILAAADTTPILGVCLGHQAIVEACGGWVVRAPEPVHGKSSTIKHDGKTIFANAPHDLEVGRYHSLMAGIVPEDLEVSATTGSIVMGVRHKRLPIEGVQFHPESILTQHGALMLSNFLAGGRS